MLINETFVADVFFDIAGNVVYFVVSKVWCQHRQKEIKGHKQLEHLHEKLEVIELRREDLAIKRKVSFSIAGEIAVLTFRGKWSLGIKNTPSSAGIDEHRVRSVF